MNCRRNCATSAPIIYFWRMGYLPFKNRKIIWLVTILYTLLWSRDHALDWRVQVLFYAAKLRRICTESKAAKTLHTKVAGAVQSLVVGHVSVLRVLDLLAHIDEHHLLGYEGTYLPTVFYQSFICDIISFFWYLIIYRYISKFVCLHLSNAHV